MTSSVSIVIPTLNATRYIDKLLYSIQNQSYQGSVEVIVIDSDSDDNTATLVEKFPFARVIQISRKSFTHGYARNLGVREARGEYVVFLSQDALPYHDLWLSHLVAPLMSENVAASYSRQIPYSNATPMEAHFLKTRFPDKRKVIKVESSSKPLQLLDVFFSNVSSAAKRDLALENPFREDLIMSEDQQFSRDLLAKGYLVLYEPASIVWHSHRYNLSTIFQRYFDSAYSLTCIFHQTLGESVKIGQTYYWGEMWEMMTKHPLWLPYYFLYLIAKTTGVVAGHYASIIPPRWVKRFSMHKGFWERSRV